MTLFGPETTITYICSRSGEGVAVSLLGYTEDQLITAIVIALACESSNGKCREDCELKKFANTNGMFDRYKQMFGGTNS